MKYLDYREIRKQGTFEFPVAYYHIAPGHPRYEMPYHWHPEYEIIRIVRGSFQFTLAGETEDVTEGQLLFLGEGVLHGGIPRDCTYECIVFDLDYLLKNTRLCFAKIQNILDHRIIIWRRPDMTVLPVRSAADNLFESITEKRDGYELVTLGCIFQLLGALLANGQYSITPDAIPTDGHRLVQCKKVLDYMEKNFAENISLDQISKIAGMSPKYFCRYFKTMTQRTPIDYLNYYRIETACELLSSRYITVTEAAQRCGFHDTSYFVKQFRRYKGVTPKQYLKENFR
jgi:AraC-like DNA-binding protein